MGLNLRILRSLKPTKSYLAGAAGASAAGAAAAASAAGAAAPSAGAAAASAAGAAGSGRFEPCELMYSNTAARSSGLPSPAKVILLPGAYFLGLASHWLIHSQSQLPETAVNALE